MNHVPYARAFNETDTRITLNQRVLSVHREPDREPEGGRGRLCVEIGSDTSAHRAVRHVDAVIVDRGAAAEEALYRDLKPLSSNLGVVDVGALLGGRPQTLARNRDGLFQLFRIGDAIANRNIHAAVYDALRLLKDV